MNKRTPGPWEIKLYPYPSRLKKKPCIGISSRHARDFIAQYIRSDADARLIAAASEIADKLKEIVNALDTINDFNSILFGGMGGPLRIHPKILDEAKALLRRIEGDEKAE